MYLWLIFRYQINDKLAFPLLLRGLEHTDNWTTLKRVELKDDIATPDILNHEVNYCFLLKVSSCLTKLTFFFRICWMQPPMTILRPSTNWNLLTICTQWISSKSWPTMTWEPWFAETFENHTCRQLQIEIKRLWTRL